MGSLVDFRDRIRKAVAGPSVADNSTNGPEYMSEFQQRQEGAERLIRKLVETVVRPRVAELASHFPNATLGRHRELRRCGVWLGYAESFPANARAEFTLRYDDELRSVVIAYHSHIVPAFIQYDRFDRKEVAIEAPSEDLLAAWVEQCLLRFVQACVAISQSRRNDEESMVTDPVCGMQVNQSRAAPHSEYLGHAYFFCSPACRDQFAAEPLKYVTVTTDY
ncbi:MAG: YHS domain-containing protein [Pirellulales bacterium]|nr:YHS domain-containing protein [Pirellulales bacterium]